MWDDDFCGLIVAIKRNKDTTWLKFLRAHLPHHIFSDPEKFFAAPTPKVLVLHYEELTKRRKGKVDWRFAKELAKIEWSLIVWDESHRLKDRTTWQSKAAARFRLCKGRKMVLSGTPIEERPTDLWAQFRFFAPEVFGTVYKDFENEYLEEDSIDLKNYRPGSFMFHKMMRVKMIMRRKRAFREDMLPEFLERIRPFCLRVTQDVLGLPGLFLHNVPVRLRGRQAGVYRELERDMVSHISSSTKVTAPLRITQIGKLHQVCGGHVIDDDGEAHTVGRAKLRKTMAIIKRNKKPIVIFCRYLEEVRALEEELSGSKYRVETLTGKTKKIKGQEAVQDRFQNGEIDILICQVKTGGVGIDLFRSCIGIFYSTTYSFIDFDQALKRLQRRGQESIVNIFLVYALGTVDEDVYTAVRSKRLVTETILKRLKRQGAYYGKREERRQS